jgi:hemolysin activation/secretion protein
MARGILAVNEMTLTVSLRRSRCHAASRVAGGALAVALFAVSTAASAQTVRPPTREELQIGEPGRTAGKPNRLTVEGGIERGPCPLADPAYAHVTVDFASVSFPGLTAVPPEALEPAWREFAGREVPIAALCEIRDRTATLLRRQGYLAAVQIPPQRVDKGDAVRMDVLIARLAEVQLRGEPGNSERLIAAHIAKLTRHEYFNIHEAERQLLLLGDLPGFDVRLTLRPTDKPGEVFGDILVVRRPLEVVAGLQNLGSSAAGRLGAFAQATVNDVTGLGDRTEISLFNTLQTSEQTVLRIGHDFALGSDGWRLGGSFVYGRGEPSLEAAKIRSETLIGKLEGSYPLIRRQALTLRAAGGIEAVNQTIDFAGIRLSEDRLRVLFARLDLDMIDKASLGRRPGYSDSEPYWRLAASLEARQGLSGLGASKDCSPLANCLGPKAPISNFLADPSAFLLRMESVAEYRPTPEVAVILAPRAQYSSSTLLGYEQFSLGNYTIGRGLDPGTIQGDSGVGASLELRFGQRSFGPSKGLRVLPYGFLDAAWAWRNDNGFTPDPQRVLTAGGGVRVPWGGRFESNLMLAVPLERAATQTRRGDVRLLFTIAARLAPWN